MTDENLTDQRLTCAECRKAFLFSAQEQAVFAERGFKPPRRCLGCRRARRRAAGLDPAGGDRSDVHEVTCARCGAKDTVTFRPDGRGPVYCRACLPGTRPPAAGLGSAR